MAWSSDAELRGFFKGTRNCLSALFAAGRYEDLLALVEMAPYDWWDYRRYGVKALAALGRKAEALRYAGEKGGLNDSPIAIARACEEILLSSGLADEAIALAKLTPCSPQTLTRAARDFALAAPEFAIEAGMAALRWLVEGYGYEITGLDVLNAYTYTMKAAEKAGRKEETLARVRDLVAGETFGDRFVTRVLGRKLELPQ